MEQSSPPTLEDAIRALARRDGDHASQRNDIGFNGADTNFGHSLAERPERVWSLKMKVAAHNMLRKYAGQLASVGIDYSAIPVPGGEGSRRSNFAPARANGYCSVCRKPFSGGESIGFAKRADGRYDRFHERCAGQPSVLSAPVVQSGPMQSSAPTPVSGPSQNSAPTTTSTLPQVDIVGPRVVDVLGPQGSIARALGDKYEHRPQQLTLAEKIERAMYVARRGDPVQGTENVYAHVIAEAGTGTGKSFAYAIPAAQRGKKTIVTTAVKALQDQLLRKDLPAVDANVEGGVTYATLKGRTNYVCRYVHAQAKAEMESGGAIFTTPEAPQQFALVDAWIASGAADEVDGDLERGPTLLNGDAREALTVDSDGCLGKKCPLFGTCFVERAKERAKSAQIVVVNHALLLIDAKVKEASEGHASILPQSDALVIDEAHRLEEYATNALGEELSPGRWLRYERMLDRFTRKHKEAGEGADEWMMLASEVGVPWFAFFNDIKDLMADRNETQLVLGDETAAAAPALKALDALVLRMERAGAPKWLDESESERWGKLAMQIEKLADWLRIAVTPETTPEEKFVRYAEAEKARYERGQLNLDDAHVVVKIKPIDVSGYLHDIIWKAYPSVSAVSATLAVAGNFSQWRRRVGCFPNEFPDTAEYVCDSPFPYRENSVLYVPTENALPSPRVNSFQEQERYFDALAEMERRLVLSGSDRIFLLFTSNKALRAVMERMIDGLPAEWEVFVQGAMQRDHIVEAFKTPGGKKVLFATRTFFEGIDLQGDALTMVVIDKLPFPAHTDPIIAAKSKLVERRGGNSFAEIMLPEVVNTLKQGTGRLIRTSKDYGVVALLDPRLRTARYGQTIMRSLPPMRPASDLREVAALYAEKGA